MSTREKMNYAKVVRDFAKYVSSQAYHVAVNREALEVFAHKVYTKNWPKIQTRACSQNGIFKIIVFNALNFCYWYGRANLSPTKVLNQESGTTLLWSLINSNNWVNNLLDSFCTLEANLLSNRYTLLRERLQNLNELKNSHSDLIPDIILRCPNPIEVLSILISAYPICFGCDQFLKRAILTINMLHLELELFTSEDMLEIPIAADYQLPKILEAENVLVYSKELKQDIDNNVLLPSGSQKEVEIRAATIMACEQLARILNTSEAKLDNYLWSLRNNYKQNYHLTITTDY